MGLPSSFTAGAGVAGTDRRRRSSGDAPRGRRRGCSRRDRRRRRRGHRCRRYRRRGFRRRGDRGRRHDAADDDRLRRDVHTCRRGRRAMDGRCDDDALGGRAQAHARKRQRGRLDDGRLRRGGHESEAGCLAISRPGEEAWECGGARHRTGEQQHYDDPPRDTNHGSDPRCREHHSNEVSAGRDEGLNHREAAFGQLQIQARDLFRPSDARARGRGRLGLLVGIGAERGAPRRHPPPGRPPGRARRVRGARGRGADSRRAARAQQRVPGRAAAP